MFDFYKLDNGVKVVLVPMPGVQSVAVGVYIGTGSRYETPEINGISHFMEHMVFKGTKNYPTSKDTSQLEGLGAIQNAWTDVDATSYYCKIPADKNLQALDLLKDLALYPTFPQKDLEIEKGVIIEEIRMYDDKPEHLVGKHFQKMLYGDNGLGQTVVGLEKVIKSLDRAQLNTYHQSHYVSANMLVTVAGRLDNKLKAQIEQYFGQLPVQVAPTYITPLNNQAIPKVDVHTKKDIKQIHLALGGIGLSVSDPRRYALGLLLSILGQGLSSRLFMEMREKRGLCYSVHAGDEKFADIGHWDVYMSLNPNKLQEAIRALLEQLALIKADLVSEAELTQAKEKARGGLIFSQEDPMRQMDFYARQVLDRPQEVLHYDSVLDRLMQVTTEDIRQIAQDLFKTEKLNLAVVGPIEVEQKQKLLDIMKI